MDIMYVLIGFVCGFICREVIFRKQVALVRAEVNQWLNQQEEKRNGDN